MMVQRSSAVGSALRCAIGVVLLFAPAAGAATVQAQSPNLVQNPSAAEGTTSWEASGAATTEKTKDGNPHFVVRSHGSLSQDMRLPEKAAGKFLLLIGRLGSEASGGVSKAIGLPYLSGYLLGSANKKGGLIQGYLQSDTMLFDASKGTEWVVGWGIFKIPANAASVRLLLLQTSPAGSASNDSAARFDDLGVYVFASQQEAQAFVKTYDHQQH